MKESIIRELTEHRGKYISGQHLSDMLGISRTAVWKYINTLREQGYKIEAVTSRGYRLLDSPDILIPEEIYPLLKTSVLGRTIIYKDTIASTSTLAKEIATGQKEGTVVLVEEQSGGRGRLGRQWYSPRGGGIWASIILKPRLRPDRAFQITQVAAVAVVKAIKRVTGLSAGIKWPNDIIVNKKKVCGILTEMSAEADVINYIILSIGLNVNSFRAEEPDELQGKIAFLDSECGFTVSRKELLAVLLQELEVAYTEFVDCGLGVTVEDCRKFSVMLGREVRIMQMDSVLVGKAVDITEEGALLVETLDGRVKVISGDVSVRGINGYV